METGKGLGLRNKRAKQKQIRADAEEHRRNEKVVERIVLE